MDITSYLLGKNAGGGSEINNQNKNVTITTNGSSTVSADAGYTGLGTVGITTNVQPNLETLTETITENGTTTYTPSQNKDGFSSVSITTNVSGGGGADLSDYFISSITNGSATANGVSKTLKKLPDDLQVSSTITTAQYMFANCNCLTSIPLQLDTSNITNMKNMFSGCTRLETLPQLNTAKVTNMQYMFQSCNSLSDTSLDNILQMCINATSYTGTKTLYQLGFDSTYQPATTIQGLPHYQAFLDAGWTIGY